MTPGTVRLDVPIAAEALYDYLTDPRHRPDWQSSLRAISDLRGHGGAGSSWADVTVLGARPKMRVLAAERPRNWVEVGRWYGLSATLTLDLVEYAPGRTLLAARFQVTGDGLWALPARVLQTLARPAIEADLRRAVSLADRA